MVTQCFYTTALIISLLFTRNGTLCHHTSHGKNATIPFLSLPVSWDGNRFNSTCAERTLLNPRTFASESRDQSCLDSVLPRIEMLCTLQPTSPIAHSHIIFLTERSVAPAPGTTFFGKQSRLFDSSRTRMTRGFDVPTSLHLAHFLYPSSTK